MYGKHCERRVQGERPAVSWKAHAVPLQVHWSTGIRCSWIHDQTLDSFVIEVFKDRQLSSCDALISVAAPDFAVGFPDEDLTKLPPLA